MGFKRSKGDYRRRKSRKYPYIQRNRPIIDNILQNPLAISLSAGLLIEILKVFLGL